MIANLHNKRQRQLALAILVAFIAAPLCITALPIWAANASRNATLVCVKPPGLITIPAASPIASWIRSIRTPS